MFQSAQGNFFGYTEKEVIGFFGIALFASGLAQSVTVGVIRNLARTVWQGEFDFWLLQPPPISLRIITEDLGIIWYWPHIIVGITLMGIVFPPEMWIKTIVTAIVSSTIEMIIVFMLCIPAIRWGRWNPYEGLWEYFENARLVPIGQSRNFMLWFVSFGVLHYSLALEVLTGRLPLWILATIAIILYIIAWLLLKFFLRSYSSASS
jgi:ABC-type uncharacterized transport system permease subunit